MSDAPRWLTLRGSRSIPESLTKPFEEASPPIPVQRIVEELGVSIHFMPSAGWKGAVRSEEGRADIWLNANLEPAWQRWVLAHELGHLLLHPLGSEFRDESLTGNEFERDANEFAGRLLMPTSMIRELAARVDFNADTVAEIFHVPVDFAKAQLDAYLSRTPDGRRLAHHR